MPTLHRFGNCVIRMYANDHLPPHFHVGMNDGRECLVEIDTLRLLAGRVSRREIAERAGVGTRKSCRAAQSLEGVELMKAEFPRALRVEALEPCRLRIRWDTGETLDVDLAEKLKGRALARLRQPELFAKAHAACGGACVEWEDSEFGADNVYAWTREQMGEPSHEMFFGWMYRNQLTLDDAAKALGLSRRMISYYRSGRKPIPQYVWLACIGWERLHEKKAA